MIGLVIALAASASGAPSQPAVAPSARWEFRVCTFRALDVRLRKIYISPTHDGLIEEVFQDCATELAELRRGPTPSGVEKDNMPDAQPPGYSPQ